MSRSTRRPPLLAALLLLFLFALPAAQAAPFMLGVDVFMTGYTHLVRGKRVGLLTNQTGRNAAGQATIDLLYRDPNVNLVAIFAPEHGVRGVAAAGEHVDDSVDRKTGLPVFSLYGGNGHRPSAAMLSQVDVLIYDIQDVGSRAYTYIWSMAEALAACGEDGKEFIVLDRPNPLGGLVVDGPVTEPRWKSFLGLYPIPRVYGMTPGELARYFNAEHRLGCKLTVIPMSGWTRTANWRDTRLTWVPSSPNIPTAEAAVGFAATGTIGTLGFLHIGIGTRSPFQFVGAGWINAGVATAALNDYGLPGVTFVPVAFTPTTGGMKGQEVQAIYLQVTDPARFLPTSTEVAMIHYLQRAYPRQFKWPSKANDSFDKAMGTSSVRESLERGASLQQIRQAWQPDLDAFRARRAKYLIYR